jgi:hypothetical protein
MNSFICEKNISSILIFSFYLFNFFGTTQGLNLWATPSNFLKKLLIHLFICVYIVWATSPLAPHSPSPLPLPRTLLASRQNLFCPVLQKDTAFLLAWDKDSSTEIPSIASMHMCITIRIGSSPPDLFTTSLSPSHSGLCQFKITLFPLLLSGHIKHFHVLDFLPFPSSSCACSLLSVWPTSNNITAFVLGLQSAYEGEHTIFGLLSLANFA